MQKLVFLLLLSHVPFCFFGQTDTVLTIAEVEIRAARISKVSTASSLQVIDSQLIALQPLANLTELLSGEAGLFFKTYGQGSLGTSTLRGGSAGHTVVVWNGFNLQNTMNGVADFALFPVWMTDGVSLHRGGGGSLQGSGSVGGAVLLEDRVGTHDGLRLRLGGSAGSFGDFRQFGSASLRGERVGGQVKFFHQNAENDFPLPGKNGERQQNAAQGQWLVTQNNLLKINDKQTLESFFWLQRTHREIPPSITEANAHARQEDGIARMGLAWSRVGERAVTTARAALLDETLLYFSDVVDSSRSHARTWIGEVEHAVFFKKNQVLRVGLQANRQWAETQATGEQTRNRTALFASWQQFFLGEKMSLSADARQELVDGGFIPAVASANLDARWCAGCRSHIRVTKNYNLPTFNDLYWQDAFARGNPALRPETAWGGELGTGFTKKINALKLTADLTGFSSRVKDWILWAPKGSIWTPENKRTVWARGLEASLTGQLGGPDDAFRMTGHLRWSYIRSTIEEIYGEDDPRLLGKQLVYTPMSSGSAGLSFFYKKYLLAYRHFLAGKRYTTTDNREGDALPPFHTASLMLGRSLAFSGNQVEIQLSLLNLWNADYQPIAARPMPGRHFRLEVRTELFAKRI